MLFFGGRQSRKPRAGRQHSDRQPGQGNHQGKTHENLRKTSETTRKTTEKITFFHAFVLGFSCSCLGFSSFFRSGLGESAKNNQEKSRKTFGKPQKTTPE